MRACQAAAIMTLLTGLSGCAGSLTQATPGMSAQSDFEHAPARMYEERYDSGFKISAVKSRYLTDNAVRHSVNFEAPYPPGSIVIDTGHNYLYLVQSGNTAIRYAVGVGRDGFEWSGTAEIGRKEEWPTWTPPSEMIDRDPRLEPYRDGMAGGPDNPLGARALYLFQNGTDTLYRIHGTDAD